MYPSIRIFRSYERDGNICISLCSTPKVGRYLQCKSTYSPTGEVVDSLYAPKWHLLHPSGGESRR